LKNCVKGLLTISQDEKEPRGDDSIDCAGQLLQALRVGSQKCAIQEARSMRSGAREREKSL
jgi:hypothetical protein